MFDKNSVMDKFTAEHDWMNSVNWEKQAQDFTLTPARNIHLASISFTVLPANWLARVLWPLLRLKVECSWAEEKDKG